MVVVDLADWPHFFDEAAVGFAIGRAIGLAISGAVLTGTNIAIGFSRLSL